MRNFCQNTHTLFNPKDYFLLISMGSVKPLMPCCLPDSLCCPGDDGKRSRMVIVMLVLFVFCQTGVLTAQAETGSVVTSSKCVRDYDPGVDYFPDKAVLTHAEGFSLEYHRHYKVLTVNTPWPGARRSFRYYLVQCGTPVPRIRQGDQVIPIPIDTVAMLSITHLPHLILLDVVDRLVAVNDTDFVSSIAIRQRIEQGDVREIARGPSINTEVLLDLAPRLVMVSGNDQPGQNDHPALQASGIQFVINAEYVEPTLLGRSEWLKFTAAFFNREGRAEQYFDSIKEKFESFRALTQTIPRQQKPSVFGGSLFRDIWHVAGGKSYAAELIAVAGGRYVWADDTHRGAIPLSFETVYDRASEASVWITGGLQWRSRIDLLAANERYADFNAFKNGRVYNNNRRLSPLGGNDFWETGVVEPHLLLADMIKILHPDRLPTHQLKYYLRLP